MQRHGELLETMHQSKSEHKRKIAELMEQNDDLEETLLMVRNSWTQTGNVMENQVEAVKKKMRQVEVELKEYKLKYNNLLPEYEEITKKLEKIREEKFKSTEAVSDLELKSAAKLVEITKLRNELIDHKAQNEKLQYLVLKLLQVCPKNENGDIMFKNDGNDDLEMLNEMNKQFTNEVSNVLQLNNNEIEQHMTANLMNFAIDGNGNTLQNMVDLHDSNNKLTTNLIKNKNQNTNESKDNKDNTNGYNSDSSEKKDYHQHIRARGSLSFDPSQLSSLDNVEDIAKAVDLMQKDFERTENAQNNDDLDVNDSEIDDID